MKIAKFIIKNNKKKFCIKLKDFSEFNIKTKTFKLSNYINGEWRQTANYEEFPDPLKGSKFLEVPLTEPNEMNEIISSMKTCPKYGLHNPLMNVDRYLLYGQICRKVTQALYNEEIFDHFIKIIQKVFPKSAAQAYGEMKVTRAFFENFCGDNVRFLAQGKASPGDHDGQQTMSYRWPYGAVCIITPFNFPLEISILQMMGALFMGNKVLIKVDSKVSLCIQEFLRLLHACGLPHHDVILVHTNGPNMEYLLKECNPRMTLFTGSSNVAERLSRILHGRIKIEDAGFDWKILGPDVSDIDYVAHISDQDAYALSGQKCSAQSLLFAHKNWVDKKIFDKLKLYAESRSLKNGTLSPIMTWNNKKIQDHIDNLIKIEGAHIIFGGEPINEQNSIPEVYGSYKPTAIFIPLSKFEEHFDLITTEVFGPVQIVTEYIDSEIEQVISIIDRLNNFLTAGVVSNDVKFLNKIIGKSVNGVTYSGIRARTTGAPQNHWFGPCGDPRAGGIGTKEAIQLIWSSHREVITDIKFPKNYVVVQS